MNQKLMDQIIAFRNARDWAKFHTPENLAKSISIEAAELLEHFQWGDPIDEDAMLGIADELADILIYAHIMAHTYKLDPESIMLEKLKRNEGRFPVDKVRGNSGKYTRVNE